MRFGGNVFTGIHKISAAVRAGLLSLPATYRKSDGSEYTVYLSPEPTDSLTTYGVLSMDGEQMMTKYKLFTVVLAGQDCDFITNRPTADDLIEIEINGIAETWYVTKGASASCWGFMHGNEKIWILTSKFDPRKQ